MDVLNPADLLSNLHQTTVFKNWKKKHSEAFLSHFFCPITKDFQAKSYWDIGYFNPQDEKIAIFSHQGKNNFIIKPEEEVFKKENTKVEVLEMDKVKFSFEESVNLLKEKIPTLFPNEHPGDGFIILQSFSDDLLWNFTFMSLSMKFLNVKINAETGEINSHQIVNVIQKDVSA